MQAETMLSVSDGSQDNEGQDADTTANYTG